MKEIPLTQGKVAIVDDEDFEWISDVKWHLAKTRNNSLYYAKTDLVIDGKRTSIRMHQAVVGRAPQDFVFDHINGNGLDNRKENLRIVTRNSNCLNRHSSKPRARNGAVWEKQRNKWKVRITINGKTLYLGLYDDKTVAEHVYQGAIEAIERYREKAMSTSVKVAEKSARDNKKALR